MAMQAVEPSHRMELIIWWSASGRRVCWREPAPHRGRVRATDSYWSWLPIHPGRSVWTGRAPLARVATCGALAQYLGGLVRWRGASFFICQPQLGQNIVDGRQGTIQLHGLTQFCQGQIRLPRQKQLHLLLVGGKNAWLGAGKAVARGNVSRSPALL